jgi:hypothetical protein
MRNPLRSVPLAYINGEFTSPFCIKKTGYDRGWLRDHRFISFSSVIVGFENLIPTQGARKVRGES